MALKPPRSRLRNISNGLAKVQISIPAGDEIEVSEEVAAQLAHQGAPMRDASSEKAPKPAPVVDEQDAPSGPEKAPAKPKARRPRKASA